MTKKLKIDFVSDIVCPWCAIGLNGLSMALDRLGPDVEADITFHPFQLNPDLAKEGMVHLDYITSRMGISPTDARRMRAQIKERAASVGLDVNRDDTTFIYNSFDAHRLMAWAGEVGEGKQKALSEALMRTYFTNLRNLADPVVLLDAVETAGLDPIDANAVLASDRYREEIEREEAEWRARGVRSVPTVVVGGKHVIGGGNPPEEFERKIRGLIDGGQIA